LYFDQGYLKPPFNKTRTFGVRTTASTLRTVMILSLGSSASTQVYIGLSQYVVQMSNSDGAPLSRLPLYALPGEHDHVLVLFPMQTFAY
jgi:hypothetical protein